jgi:hypothetical protein
VLLDRIRGMDWILVIVAFIGMAVCLTAFHIWAAKDFHRITNWWDYDDDLPSKPENSEHK